MKNLPGVTLAKVWAEFTDSQKFKMAAVGQFDHDVLSGLAYIAALDLCFGIIWGKEFIYDVRAIVLQTTYL